MDPTRSSVVEAASWRWAGLIMPLVMLVALVLLAQLPGLLIGNGSEDQSPRALTRITLAEPWDTPDQNSVAATARSAGRLAAGAAVDR